MQISSNLPSPLNVERRLPQPQRPASQQFQDHHQQATSHSRSTSIAPSSLETGRGRFVMPDNATHFRGQLALREYQTVQNEGGPELLNRIDVRI